MQNKPARICVPVCVKRATDLSATIARAAKVADIIELRLDCLDNSELQAVTPDPLPYFSQSDLSRILTFRSSDQGGQARAQAEVRRDFWSSITRLPENCLVDLELDLASGFAAKSVAGQLPADWSNTICSHHDFAKVPADLADIYSQMAATPARILKIAVQAEDATDCLPILDLLARAQREGREMIAIAMGPAGILTRILGPSRGSFLTYGSLDDESATAPGQITAKDLREVFRIDHIDRQTEIFGIIGKPVGHSLSPHLHNAAFAATKVNAVHIPFEVNDASEFIRRMAHPRSRELDWNLRGLSVTTPHKSTVMANLDWIDPAAKEIGAVNTIVVHDDQLHGYNIDALGFIAPLRAKFGSLKGANCAIIGAGGAARAVLWVLRQEGARVTVFARDPDKARVVAEEFGAQCTSLAGVKLDPFEIVVNATPLGTRGERAASTAATAEQLAGVRLAYDLVYNPLETRFLHEARAAGCDTLGGIEMLIAQAVEQFKLWTGKEPAVEIMRNATLKALSPETKIQHSTSNV